METTMPTAVPPERELWSIKAASKDVGLSVPTIYGLIRDGRAKAFKIGRSTRIDIQSLRDGMRAVPLVLPEKVDKPERPAQRVEAAQPAKLRRAKAKRNAKAKAKTKLSTSHRETRAAA